MGVTWKHKLKNGNGKINTTLSSNRLKNIFTRYQDNENKSGILFKNDSKEQETKLRVHATQYLKEWKLSYGLARFSSLYVEKAAPVMAFIILTLDFPTARSKVGTIKLVRTSSL